MSKIYAGIDLHKTQFTVCILRDGLYEKEGQYPTSNEGYKAFISDLQAMCMIPEDVELAIESTGNARHFKTIMEDEGFTVTVVNTLRFKVVNLSTRKTDKNDARTLADFLSKEMLPKSHLCSPMNEGIRRILKCRSLMVQDCVALKNQAHSIMLAYGKVTKPTQFQSKKNRSALLASLLKRDSTLKYSLETLFNTLDVIEGQVKNMEKRLTEITKADRYVRLLMTIPGIGIVNACTISAYIDDINRFESAGHFSSFCGIVPWVQTSNESVHYGRITKRGPQELRTALVQCVVAMIRMSDKTQNTRLMKQYAALKENKSSGKAIIATARKLSTVIYVMLRDSVPFDITKLNVS